MRFEIVEKGDVYFHDRETDVTCDAGGSGNGLEVSVMARLL